MGLLDTDHLLVQRDAQSYKMAGLELKAYISSGGGNSSVTVGDNAPLDPDNGDLWWNSSDGFLYVYYVEADYNDGAGPGTAQWVQSTPTEEGGGGASVSVGASPPSGPQQGDLWWNTDDGLLYIYYTDANSSQWVSAAPGGGGDGAGGTLQEVTDNGNTTTNEIAIGLGQTDGAKLRVHGGFLGLSFGATSFPTTSFPVIYGSNQGGTGLFGSVGNLILQGRSSGGNNENTNISFVTGTNPTERMRIASNGDVEIGGTLGTAPNIDLSAGGNAEFQGTVGIGTDPQANTSLTTQRNNTTGISVAAEFRANGNGGAGRGVGILLSPGGNASSVQAARIDALQTTQASAATAAALAFTVAASDGSLIERMRIRNTGNVEIGGTLGTSPNIALNENGTSQFKNVTSEAVDIAADGAPDLSAGVFFNHAGGTLANPTNVTVGQSGLICANGTITGFGNAYKNVPDAFEQYQLIAYYAKSASEIILGSPIDYTN